MLLSYVNLGACLVYLLSGIFVMGMDPGKKLNRLFLILALCFSGWSGVNLLVQRPGTSRELAATLLHLGAVAWIFFPVIVLLFIAELTRASWVSRARIWLLVALPGCFFLGARLSGNLFNTLKKTSYGYNVLWQGTWGEWAYNLYFISYSSLALWMCWRFVSEEKELSLKKTGQVVFWGGVLTLLSGVLLNVILASFVSTSFPRLAHLTFMIFVLSIFYALIRFELFLPTVEGSAATLIHAMPEAVILANSDGAVVSANPSALALWGGTLRQIQQKKVQDLIHRERGSDAESGCAHPHLESSGLFMEADGTERHISVASTTIMDSQGSAYGTVHVAKDIEEIHEVLKATKVEGMQAKEVGRRLLQTVERLELLLQQTTTAAKAKSEFLANMSHEIRTPVNSIIAACRLLERATENHELKENIEIIYGSAEQLRAVIDRILLFSRLEARRVRLFEQPFDIGSVLGECALWIQEQARAKGLCVKLEVPAKEQLLLGDPLQMGRIFYELADNAVKFTDSGQVALHCDLACDGTSCLLSICFSNTGEEIPVFKMRHIFKGFSQMDASRTRRHGGIGLGLAIASGLVHLMGGEVLVRTDAALGTLFEVRLALPIVMESQKTSSVLHPGAATSPPRVMVIVDDNPVTQKVLALSCKGQGYQTITCSSGPELLATVGDLPGRAVILLDIQMPGIDGFETLRLLRQTELKHPVDIIMMTASSEEEIAVRALEAGAAALLVKPVEQSSLDAVLRTLQGSGGA